MLNPFEISTLVKSWRDPVREIILRHRKNIEQLERFRKKDGSWVTAGDLEVHHYYLAQIKKNFPEHQIMSEENIDEFKGDPLKGFLWCIDPIDGTHEFMKAESNYFCSSIALYENGSPVFGMVDAPLFSLDNQTGICFEMHAGLKHSLVNGKEVFVFPEVDLQNLKADINQSNTHPDFEEGLPAKYPLFQKHWPKALALQTCLVGVSGTFDYSGLMIQHEPKLWDMAAALFIAKGAGAFVSDLKGKELFPIRFARKEFDPNYRIPTVMLTHPGNSRRLLEENSF